MVEEAPAPSIADRPPRLGQTLQQEVPLGRGPADITVLDGEPEAAAEVDLRPVVVSHDVSL